MANEPDLVTAAAQAAWLDYCNGTYSTTDEHIFKEAFVKGWMGKCYHLKLKESAREPATTQV